MGFRVQFRGNGLRLNEAGSILKMTHQESQHCDRICPSTVGCVVLGFEVRVQCIQETNMPLQSSVASLSHTPSHPW